MLATSWSAHIFYFRRLPPAKPPAFRWPSAGLRAKQTGQHAQLSLGDASLSGAPPASNHSTTLGPSEGTRPDCQQKNPPAATASRGEELWAGRGANRRLPHPLETP
eukprot:2442873-Pyramimonas_sp.AAC.1